MIVTASLTSGIVRVTRGLSATTVLVDEILAIEHTEWETTLYVGDVAFYQSKNGPFADHQFRLNSRPKTGYAACHYTDNDDSEMPSAISWNPVIPSPEVDLIFNGTTGAVFPRTAAIPIADARRALLEWVQSRQRPSCIQWHPYELY